MTTKITFDNAQLSDAFTKASRVAPTKGAAFDKAAGFHMTVNPITCQMVLRATNIDTSYLQKIPAVEGSGDEAVWRLPSVMLSSLMSALPMAGGDAQTTFIDRGDGFIRVTSGSVKARLNTLRADDFPLIPDFDPSTFKEANEFASKVDQVAWACDKKSSILSGVHIDGEQLVGCNQTLLAVVPCPTSVANPITVPLFTLAPILKSATDVSIGSDDKRFLIGLDAETRATSLILEGEFPNYKNIMRTDFAGTFKVRKATLVDSMQRMLSLFRAERLPVTKVLFDGTGLLHMITFDMDVPDTGRMMDTIDCLNGDFSEKLEINLNPDLLLDAVSHSKDDTVDISFGHADPEKAWRLPIRVTDEHGYICYLMPRKG